MAFKKIIGWFIVINLLLGTVLWGLKAKLNSTRIEHPQYPVTLAKFSTMGLYPSWVFKEIQPILVGYVTENNRNYLKVKYPEADGKITEKKVLVTGQVREGKAIETILLENKTGKVETLGFDKLKKQLKVNQQIRVEYMASVPKSELLQGDLCERIENYCLLVDLINLEKADNMIYAVKIYLNLQNE